MDFARVADDESRHLGWCLQRLAEMGVSYGDIPAHSMLWEGAQKSAGESLVPQIGHLFGNDLKTVTILWVEFNFDPKFFHLKS